MFLAWVLVVQFWGNGGGFVIDSIASKENCLEMKEEILKSRISISSGNIQCISYYKRDH